MTTHVASRASSLTRLQLWRDSLEPNALAADALFEHHGATPSVVAARPRCLRTASYSAISSDSLATHTTSTKLAVMTPSFQGSTNNKSTALQDKTHASLIHVNHCPICPSSDSQGSPCQARKHPQRDQRHTLSFSSHRFLIAARPAVSPGQGCAGKGHSQEHSRLLGTQPSLVPAPVHQASSSHQTSKILLSKQSRVPTLSTVVVLHKAPA